MDGLIVRLKELDAELTPCYYALEYETDVVDMKDKVPFVIAREFPKADVRYFDLVAIHILLANHNKILYDIPPEIVELTCTLFTMANRRCKVFAREEQAVRFYEDLAFGRVPADMLVYQFLNHIVKVKDPLADVWFSYILLIWAISPMTASETRPYRSRALVSFINRTYVTSNRNEHGHDLLCDNLRILDSLRGYITLCTNDTRYHGKDYIAYMVDSIRQLVVIYLAALLRRSCTWLEFCKLGGAVLVQKSRFHSSILKMHHDLHKETGAVNQ